MKWRGETLGDWEKRMRDEGKRCYAWFPTQMDDGGWIWLEHYWAFMVPRMNGNFSWSRAVDKEDARPYVPMTPPPPLPTKR